MGFHLIADDIDDVSSVVVKNGFSYKQKRLPRADMALYGERQDWDVFTVVTCFNCGMILKPQALNDHVKKRHSRDSISDDSNSSDDTNFTDKTNITISTNSPTDAIIKHKPKRQRVDKDPGPNIESFQLGQCSSNIFQPTNNFYKSNSLQNSIVQQPRKPEIKMRLKLKKSGPGTWSVMTA